MALSVSRGCGDGGDVHLPLGERLECMYVPAQGADRPRLLTGVRATHRAAQRLRQRCDAVAHAIAAARSVCRVAEMYCARRDE